MLQPTAKWYFKTITGDKVSLSEMQDDYSPIKEVRKFLKDRGFKFMHKCREYSLYELQESESICCIRLLHYKK